eukprot:127920-Pyramimonas_sp.AAC.1
MSGNVDVAWQPRAAAAPWQQLSPTSPTATGGALATAHANSRASSPPCLQLLPSKQDSPCLEPVASSLPAQTFSASA